MLLMPILFSNTSRTTSIKYPLHLIRSWNLLEGSSYLLNHSSVSDRLIWIEQIYQPVPVILADSEWFSKTWFTYSINLMIAASTKTLSKLIKMGHWQTHSIQQIDVNFMNSEFKSWHLESLKTFRKRLNDPLTADSHSDFVLHDSVRLRVNAHTSFSDPGPYLEF